MNSEKTPTVEDLTKFLDELVKILYRQEKSTLIELFNNFVELESQLSCHMKLEKSLTFSHENGEQYEFFMGIKNAKHDEDEENDDDEDFIGDDDDDELS